jgi:hypothetical protein
VIPREVEEVINSAGYVIVEAHAATTASNVIVVKAADDPRLNTTAAGPTGWASNDWQGDWPAVEVDEDGDRLPTVLELAKERATKKRRVRERGKRRGRGHDPKFQARARAGGGGRGRGRR